MWLPRNIESVPEAEPPQNQRAIALKPVLIWALGRRAGKLSRVEDFDHFTPEFPTDAA
jgi:hypothetical protein